MSKAVELQEVLEKDAKALVRAIGEALAGGARRFDVEEWKVKYATHGEGGE